jgi:hypothetical protein
MGVIYAPPSVAPITIAPIVPSGADLGTPGLPFGAVFADTYSNLPNRKNTIQTVDATLTTIASITLAADEMFSVEALISGDGPTGKNYWAKLIAGFRKDGAGAAALVGPPYIVSGDEGATGYAATLAVAGDDLLIQVQGAIAETVDWVSFHLYTGAVG